MDADSGRDTWSRDARKVRLHSTRIHGESASLMIADPTDGGVLRFVRLDDGADAGLLRLPGEWTGEFSERPESPSNEREPLVLECPPSSFVLVRGQTPGLESIDVAERI